MKVILEYSGFIFLDSENNTFCISIKKTFLTVNY